MEAKNRAIRLLDEALDRINQVELLFREEHKERMGDKAYTISGKILALKDDTADLQ